MIQREVQTFTTAFEELNEELHSTTNLLTNYYSQALEEMQSGKFIVNSGIIKELRMYLSQITKIATIAGSGASLFLLEMTNHEDQEMPEADIEKYIEKYRDSNDIPLSKTHLQDKFLGRIKIRCSGVTSINLVSNPLKLEEIITDIDISKLKPFSRMSTLALRGSNISEEGLKVLSQGFENLKEIDISKCRFVGSNGLRWLSGYKYVSIKANKIEGVSEQSISNLIATSYNLNYLELSNISRFDYHQLLSQISRIYQNNQLNFKWLQIICNLGTILFVNKLAYLTHLTTVDSITDRQVKILLGEQPLLDGLYINCCEQLHTQTVKALISKCSKLKRLGLRRYINLTDALVEDLVSSMPRLQYLDISECCSLTSRAIIHIANQLSKLKQICIAKCVGVTDEGVLYLIEKMPCLGSIDLSYCKNITDEVVFKLCNELPNLKQLNLSKCEHITNDAVAYISEKLVNLTTLILNGCEILTDESLSLVTMRLRRLVRFQVEWCSISQKCVDFIAQNLNELQVVNLNYCHSVCDEALFGLAKHSAQLRSIAIASCQKISSKGFLRLFGTLKKLRELDLRQCIGVDDLAIQYLCQNSRGELVKLDLSWCSSITDAAVLQLSQFQQQLLYLNLNGCSEISDNAISWLCTSMKQLEDLNLSLCQNLTDTSVFEISNNLPSLRTLSLSELKSITDASVSSLAGLPNLQELHICGCQQVTSSSLIALLHNLQKLQCLNISQCPNIFAESLILLVERMRNLKRFYIASLEVTDRFLDMIGEYMQRLQVINMEYCRKITDQGVLRMIYRTPSLLRIDIQNTSITQKTKKTIFDQLSTRSLYDVLV